MKTKITLRFNGITALIILLFILQSCKIYHSENYPKNQAVKKELPVKVYTTDQNNYEFKQLVYEHNQLYGLVSKHSYTAKRLKEDITDEIQGSSLVKIELDESQIQKIKVKNKGASTAVTILGVGVSIGGLILILQSTISPSVPL